MTPTQLSTVLFLAFVLVVMLPVYRSRRQRGDKPLLSRFTGGEKEVPAPRRERNGTKADLLIFASMVTKVVKQNKWFVIIPGYVAAGEERAALSGIVITRRGVVAFKTYGFGGQIIVQAGEWQQQINGVTRPLPNLKEDCQKQEAILTRVLEQCGLGHLPHWVCAVFTTDETALPPSKDSMCFTKEGFVDYLLSPEHQEDAGLDPREIGHTLSARVVRQ
ncbi:MAG: hypothetical protein HFF50_10375 [Lawsonibacter sp.]|nr:hypothetical protein [Lawsonibacter sp.]